jgi:DNA-binding response OmpR family regulator
LEDAARVLVVDDEILVASSIARLLTKAPLRSQVEIVEDPEEGLRAILSQDYDAVLLDWHFQQRVTGIEICRSARALGSTTPVIMWTIVDSVEARYAAYEAGADEFLVKGVTPSSEVMARVAVAIHRHRAGRVPPTAERQWVRCGPLAIDLTTESCLVNGTPRGLSPAERKLLVVLAKRRGEFLAPDLLSREAGVAAAYNIKNVQNQVHRLRARLGPEASSHIRSLRGKGYRLL